MYNKLINEFKTISGGSKLSLRKITPVEYRSRDCVYAVLDTRCWPLGYSF